jgi:uncharacterized membrane protein
VETRADELIIFVLHDGRQEGPFSLLTVGMQLEAGVLNKYDFCWRPEWTEWKPIGELRISTPSSAASKRQLILTKVWQTVFLIIGKILTLFRWVTPKYWLLRKHRRKCLALASKKLPPSYDPVGDEILRRSRIIVPAAIDQTDPLPHLNAISDIVGRLDEAVAERRRLIIGTVEMATYTDLDVASGFAAIDKNIFEGISHLRSEQITTLSDLSKTLSGYDHNIWGKLSEGALAKVAGHVGESVVSHHLQTAGLHVDWPEASNNPGWDIAVNGEHLDVKAAAKDMWSGSIYSHFADHPDIPVVVAGDALNIPSDAIHFNSETGTGFATLTKTLEHGGAHHVIVDDALSHSYLHEHVQHATSTALGSHHIAHAHFPLVTFALSGWKEMKLLFNDKTDLHTALKHVSLDTAGTGIGGLAGAKTGAIIGSFLGPIGMGLGAIAGAVGGTIAARSFTNDIKHKNFETAKQDYETAIQRLRTELYREEATAKTQLATLKNSSQNSLSSEAEGIKETLDKRLLELQKWSDSSRFVLKGEGLVLAKDGLKEFRELVTCLEKRFRQHGIWERIFWPDLSTMADEKALKFMRKVEAKLQEFILRLEIGESIPRNELLSLLGIAGVVRPKVTSYLDAIYAVQSVRQRQLQSEVQSQITNLIEKRSEAVRSLNEAVEAFAARIKDNLAPLIVVREEKEESLKSEARKLGMSF